MKILKFLMSAICMLALAVSCDTIDEPDVNDGNDDDGGTFVNPYVPVGLYKHRSLCVDFTGTWCAYCPNMVWAMNQIKSNPTYELYADRIVFAALHKSSGNQKDILEPEDAGLATAFSISSYPTMLIDFNEKFTTSGNIISNIRNRVFNYHKTAAMAGIAATSKLSEGKLTVTAKVKAAETSDFRVGAWLVEDGLYAKQTNATTLTGDFDTHNHVLRITDSKRSNTDYSGFDLGTLNEGEEGTHTFEWTLNSGWVMENCHVIVFVTVPGSKNYIVTNVVEIDAQDGSCEYEYEDGQ